MINHYKTYHIYYSEMDQSAQSLLLLYFHYILMRILLYFYLRNILNAGLLLLSGTATFTQVQDLSTSTFTQVEDRSTSTFTQVEDCSTSPNSVTNT